MINGFLENHDVLFMMGRLMDSAEKEFSSISRDKITK